VEVFGRANTSLSLSRICISHQILMGSGKRRPERLNCECDTLEGT